MPCAVSSPWDDRKSIMVEAFTKLIDKLAITLAPLLAAIFLLCVMALTLPERYPLFAAAKPLVDQYRAWTVVVLMGSSAYLLNLAVVRTWKIIKVVFFHRRMKKSRLKRLHSLTDAEKHHAIVVQR